MKRLLILACVFFAACSNSSPTAPSPVAAPPVTTPAPAPVMWTMSGTGNTVFDMPTSVSRVRIQGTWTQQDTSNFIVYVRGRLVVNEVLRTSITYDGTHLVTGGGLVEIVSSNQIRWTFTQTQ